MTPRERQSLAIYDRTPDPKRDKDRAYIQLPSYSDRSPGTYNDGEAGSLADGIAMVDGRREGRWSYLHPRQHFAYSRLTF